MKIRQAPKIQHHKNKTFSIKLNRLINVVANIFHKITKLLFSDHLYLIDCSSFQPYISLQ